MSIDITITLHWPDAGLSPNARHGHWAPLAALKRAYRADCALQAMEQGVQRIDPQPLHLTLTFFPPDRRHYDLDNLLAQMKSGLDGLADVLGVDDRDWSLTIRRSTDKGGYVRVRLQDAPQDT